MLLEVLTLGCALGCGSAEAGPFADDLAKCLVSSTTAGDRASLVRWVFAAASLHPAVEPLVTVSDANLEASNRDVAALFMRLLTDTCRDAARSALKFEGQMTIQTSFQALGQVAGQEMFTHPSVNTAVMDMAGYLDGAKLRSALETSE